MPTVVDPMERLFAECTDSSGELNVQLVKCALASAYRQGFEACLVRVYKPTLDECPVRPPVWPIDEARVQAHMTKLKHEFGVK
jgi:hypothetical protein